MKLLIVDVIVWTFYSGVWKNLSLSQCLHIEDGQLTKHRSLFEKLSKCQWIGFPLLSWLFKFTKKNQIHSLNFHTMSDSELWTMKFKCHFRNQSLLTIFEWSYVYICFELCLNFLNSYIIEKSKFSVLVLKAIAYLKLRIHLNSLKGW